MPIEASSASPRIALVAGEASGDLLGGALIHALKELYPHARFMGIGGEKMRDAGLESWWDRRELSVMGLFEVVKHLPRLLKLRKALRQKIIDHRPDVLIGIDAPDFNLGLEKSIRKEGIPTVHYVSPTVWAWRSGRAKKIGNSADLVLCLFPFEPSFYDGYGVAAAYTGHPLADQIDLDNPAEPAREALGLPPHGKIVALLPGSRHSEVSRLAPELLEAARIMHEEDPDLVFVAALADQETAHHFRSLADAATGPQIQEVIGRALEVMQASDVVVGASGTATLECMLINRPMVVVYKLAPSTYHTARMLKLVKSEHISLPNIIAGEALVPELIQDEADGATIARETGAWLNNDSRRESVCKRFDEMHRELRCDAAASAAAAVKGLLDGRQT